MVENNDLPDGKDGICYLNNAGQAPLSPDVKAAGVAAVQRSPWEAQNAEADASAVRGLFARLIGGHPENIALLPSTAFAITLAARNIQYYLKKQRTVGKILLLQDEMNSEVYAWQRICKESEGHLQLQIVPYPTENSMGWTEQVLSHLNEDVLVACLPQIHWSDGSILDLKAIGTACHQNNIQLIVDATQSIGVLPFDVNEIRPTLVACSVHKWLRGPSGLSLVYIAPSVQDSWLPLDLHGRSRVTEQDPDAAAAWDAAKDRMGPQGYPETFCKGARKFDSGGKPNPILLPMLRKSMEKVVRLDVVQVQRRLKILTEPLLEWARAHDFILTPGPHAWHLIGIRPANDWLTPERMIDIAAALRQDGIYIVVRCGAFRISPYIDTQPADIQVLLEGLTRHCT